jgi:hypothetical protein
MLDIETFENSFCLVKLHYPSFELEQIMIRTLASFYAFVVMSTNRLCKATKSTEVVTLWCIIK